MVIMKNSMKIFLNYNIELIFDLVVLILKMYIINWKKKKKKIRGNCIYRNIIYNKIKVFNGLIVNGWMGGLNNLCYIRIIGVW